MGSIAYSNFLNGSASEIHVFAVTITICYQLKTLQCVNDIVHDTFLALPSNPLSCPKNIYVVGDILNWILLALFAFNDEQVLMVRLESDLAQVLLAACSGELSGVSLNWSPGSAMVVVMASKGYPGAYEKGSVIRNLEEAEHVAPCVQIFHAGTAQDSDGNIIAMGGRVLGVTAKGTDLEEARERAYQAVEEINWPGGFYRRDIGWRALPQKQFATKRVN